MSERRETREEIAARVRSEVEASRDELKRNLRAERQEYEEQIGEPLKNHTQSLTAARADGRVVNVTVPTDDDTRTLDVDDALQFALVFAELEEDERADVEALVNEDFGAIDYETMGIVQSLLRKSKCDVLDDLLEEFFTWHENESNFGGRADD